MQRKLWAKQMLVDFPACPVGKRSFLGPFFRENQRKDTLQEMELLKLVHHNSEESFEASENDFWASIT